MRLSAILTIGTRIGLGANKISFELSIGRVFTQVMFFRGPLDIRLRVQEKGQARMEMENF